MSTVEPWMWWVVGPATAAPVVSAVLLMVWPDRREGRSVGQANSRAPGSSQPEGPAS